jgi:hypothetical protein
VEHAAAGVRVERAQADAGRSREGATGFGPARQLRPRHAPACGARAADCRWSAVYRRAEPERAGNAPASGRLRHRHALLVEDDVSALTCSAL